MSQGAFRSVLIANRGEIALRILRACRELGLETVAVATDPDKNAPHAREADRVVALGEPRAYLDAGRILAAAKESGAQAIHPGYGFLSEKADFAEAVEKAGLTWIGPPPPAMQAVGNKLSARALAEKAGVPVLPSARVTTAAAARPLGLPLLVKASSGGGGRGQRVVRDLKDLPEAVAAASREAQASFGDGTVYLERYLTSPRHVEFQILADAKGHTVHLGERECSIQRRHQKLIEESPSPALTPELRKRMGEAAVSVAKAAGYRNLGTVEFLLEGRGFYFLEVNARLQVEHPVTELVTGLDLVQWQLRIAQGEAFPLKQEQIAPRGHAIEARLCAEDPDRDFLPSSGTVVLLSLATLPGVRWDTALETGQRIGSDYDSLLGKAVAFAEERPRALRRLDEALKRSALLGVMHNTGFLRFVLNHPRFAAGEYDTGLVGSLAGDWATRNRDLPPEAETALAAARAGTASSSSTNSDPWAGRGRWLP